MRPNRRPADDASCRFLSLTACISSPGQSRTPTALAWSDCTRTSWGFSRRSIDEPYLRAEMETATGVRGLEPFRSRSHASGSLIIRMCQSALRTVPWPPSQRFLDRRVFRRSFSVLGWRCLRDGVEVVEDDRSHHEPFTSLPRHGWQEPCKYPFPCRPYQHGRYGQSLLFQHVTIGTRA